MAAKYVDIYDMQSNPVFFKQITIACRMAAYNIVNEDVNTFNHAKRLIWANGILALNDYSVSLVNNMLGPATNNPTLQAAAPIGPWADNDIQFVVNSLIDLQANK